MQRQTDSQKLGAALSTIPARVLSWVDGKDDKMTDEELKAIQETLEKQVEEIDLLKAERDSLKEENVRLLDESKKAAEELAETKKMNFTLARQIDRQPAKSAEELLNELF